MGLAGQDAPSPNAQRGYAMVALLVSIAIMGVMMSVAMPVWRQQVQREREAELVFRGEQYARAIALYQRKFPGAFPPSLDVLVQQRFLRKKYKDPMSETGEFQLLYAGAQPGGPQGGAAGARGTGGGGTAGQTQGLGSSRTGGTQAQFGGQAGGEVRLGIIGVASKSQDASIKLYKGRGRYSEWQFIYTAVSTQPGGVGMPGGQRPGAGPGMRPGMPPGMGPGGSGQGMPFPPGSGGRQGPGGQRPPGAPQPGRPPGVPRR